MSSHDNASHIEYFFEYSLFILNHFAPIIQAPEQDCSGLWSQWTIEMESRSPPTSPESSYFKGTD